MVDRSLQFEQAISGGDKATLLSYCQQQEQQSPAQEAETWRFLRLNIEDDARRSTLFPFHLLIIAHHFLALRSVNKCLSMSTKQHSQLQASLAHVKGHINTMLSWKLTLVTLTNLRS